MVTRLPITKARINLGQLVKRAHLRKEYFILEKDGFPVAGLMDIDEFEDFLESKDPKLAKQIRGGYGEYRSGRIQPLEDILIEVKDSFQKRKRKK